MSSLFQINNQIEKYFDENLDLETGEILNTELLEKLEVEKKEKTLSIIRYIQHLENNEIAIKEEEKRLKALRIINANRIDSLKKYLKSSLEIDKIEKIDFGTMRLSIAKNPPKLILSDNYIEEIEHGVNLAELILKDEKSKLTLKKKIIKDMLKEGKKRSGAKLEFSTSIRIK